MSFILKVTFVYSLLISKPIISAFLKSFRKEALTRSFRPSVGAAKLLPIPTVRSRAIIKANFFVPFMMVRRRVLVERNIYLGFFCFLLFVCITKIMTKMSTIQYIVH